MDLYRRKDSEEEPGTSASAAVSTSALGALLKSNDLSYRRSNNLPMPMPSTSSFSSNTSFNGFTTGSGHSGGGPIRTMSSLRAHRSNLYSRPHCLDSSHRSSQRNYPNGRTPILLATRKIPDEIRAEPELTSTAQKIIRSLQNVSTPVVNTGKIAMDNAMIKLLRPELKRKEPCGPPTTRSTPDLSPQSNYAPPPIKAVKLNESFRSNLNSKDTTNENQNGRRQLNKHDTFSFTNAGNSSDAFEFCDAWSFKKIVGGVRQTVDPNSDSSNSEDSVDGSNTKTTSEQRNETIAIATAPPKETWECPCCCVFSKMSDNNCICCGADNPNPMKNKSDPVEKAIDKPFQFGFNTNTSIPSAFKAASSESQPKNEKPVHLKRKADDPNPPANLEVSTAKKNETTERPKETWDCPSCWVSCKMSDDNCVCCGEANPKKNQSSNLDPIEIAVTPFKFGMSANAGSVKEEIKSPSTIEKTSDKPFQFGLKPNAAPIIATASKPTTDKPADNTNSSQFKFGSANAAPVKASSPIEKPSDRPFKFGLNANATPINEMPSQLTSDKPSDNKRSRPFQFGLSAKVAPVKESAPLTIEKQSDRPFKFGLNVNATPAPIIDMPSQPTTTDNRPSDNKRSRPFQSGLGPNAAPEKETSTPALEKPSDNKPFQFGLGLNANATPIIDTPSKPTTTDTLDTKSSSPFQFGLSPKPSSVASIKEISSPLTIEKPSDNKTFQFNPNTNATATSITHMPSQPINQKPPENKASPFQFGLSANVAPVTTAKPAEVKGGVFQFGLNPNTAPVKDMSSPLAIEKAPETRSPFQFGSNSTATTSIFGSPLVNSTSSNPTPPPPIFASSVAPQPQSQPFSLTPQTSFGSQPSAAPIFQFGGSSQSQPSNNTFSNPNANSTGMFGSGSGGGFQPVGVPLSMPQTMFGQPTSSQPTAFPSSQGFALTPNTNFASSVPSTNFGQPMPQQQPQQQPALFNLGSQPATNSERRIKKAVRRLR